MKALIALCFVLTITCSSAQELDSISSKYTGVYTLVDQPAIFPGGHKAFFKFLRSEMKYPESALEDEVEGRVFVQFIVEENGELTNLQVVKGIGAGCDEEAMRALAKSSPWNAGQIDGKPVRQIMIQNILFGLDNAKKDN
ncbi:energy transducer TonB [Ekhidna sp. To15]|uniref:energy transducer TonB n=1 Tax=Ekhidna sp. To15 TaxID=3395267 RepID=UPI003F5234AE